MRILVIATGALITLAAGARVLVLESRPTYSLEPEVGRFQTAIFGGQRRLHGVTYLMDSTTGSGTCGLADFQPLPGEHTDRLTRPAARSASQRIGPVHPNGGGPGGRLPEPRAAATGSHTPVARTLPSIVALPPRKRFWLGRIGVSAGNLCAGPRSRAVQAAHGCSTTWRRPSRRSGQRRAEVSTGGRG